MRMSVVWQSSIWQATLLLFIGLFFGIGIGFFLGVFRQRLGQMMPSIEPLQQRLLTLFRQFRPQKKQGYWSATAVYANQHHLASHYASLSDVYVPPSLLDLSAIEDLHAPIYWTGAQLLHLWTDVGKRSVHPPLPTRTVDDLLWRCQIGVVTGEQGMGKTALLAYMAHRLAVDEQKRFLPILVHLAELNLSVEGISAILPVLDKRYDGLTLDSLTKAIQPRLLSGDVTLLLDGWAELDDARQTAVLHWLQSFLATYPKMRMIMSADVQNFGALLALKPALVRVLPFTLRQAEQLIEKWNNVLDLGGVLSIKNCWQASHSPLETCLHIWQRAFGNLGLATELSLRNLLATNLSVTFVFEEATPDVTPLPKGIILFFWSQLAYTLVLRNWVFIDAGRLGQMAEETAVNYRLPREQTIAQLLATLGHSGLFVATPEGSARFLSSVWRDYLAASYMAQKGLFEDALKYIPEPRWAGVLAFLSGEQGAEALPAHLLAHQNEQNPLHPTLFRLAKWMTDTGGEANWQRQTLVLLGKLVREAQNPFALRHRALIAMTKTNQQGTLTFLTQMLSRSEPYLRRAAISVLPWLASNNPEPVIALIGKGVQDKDELVQQTAVRALALIQHTSIERILVAILIGEDEKLSDTAAEAIARYVKDAPEILREALADEEVNVRRSAIHGLTFLPDGWVIPLLQSVERNDTEWSVREAALVAIEKLQQERVQTLWEPPRITDLAWLQAYVTRKGEALPEEQALGAYLVRVLRQAKQAEVRTAAVSTLRRFLHWGQSEEVWQAVQTAVTQDENPQVREAAYLTLCAIHLAYNPSVTLQIETPAQMEAA